MMNELESKLEKLTRLTKAFEQADDSNKRSHLANELLCTVGKYNALGSAVFQLVSQTGKAWP